MKKLISVLMATCFFHAFSQSIPYNSTSYTPLFNLQAENPFVCHWTGGDTFSPENNVDTTKGRLESYQFVDFPFRKVLKKLKGDKIEIDEENEDGVFKIRHKKTKKWGMYQWMYESTQVTQLIPMEYDSLNYFPFNASFTAVYNDGKVGFYLSKWSYDNEARQTVPCVYDVYQRFTPEDGVTRLAVQKNGKWGWVDWLTGEEKSGFMYRNKEELPYPAWEQKTYLNN